MAKLHHPFGEGYPLFITTTCFEKRPYLSEPEKANICLKMIDKLRGRGVWWISEFVIMPDHVHLIISPQKSVGYCLQEFKKSTARLINICDHIRDRKIWMEEYYERVIRDDREYSETLDYIWYNPVKKGIVLHPEDFPFSSANPVFETDRAKFY